MKTHSKSDLLALNNGPLFSKCIINIENIKDNEQAKLYPTGDAGWRGRIYVALPATLVLTSEIIVKFNIWL